MGVAHNLTATGGTNVTTSYCIENLQLLFDVLKHSLIWMVPEWHAEMDYKNFENDRKMAEKYLWNSSIFRNVIDCNNFSKVSLYKKTNSLTKSFADIFSIFLCDEIELKQSLKGTLKEWKNLWKIYRIKFV